MSKRIVVGLDPSDYSKKALELAAIRAALYDGVVIGVGIVDLPGIERAEYAGAIGTAHYAKQAVDSHVTKAEERVEGLIADFEAYCTKAGVKHEVEHRTGDPAEVLVEVAMAADVIFVGTKTFFHFETRREQGDTLRELLQEKVCPVLAVPDDMPIPPAGVLIPYDSSRSAARTMRTFVQLTHEIPIAPKVTLLRVTDNVEEGRKALAKPTTYLDAYGYDVTYKVVPGSPRKIILETARATPGTIVVLGAYGKSSLTELFFGSVTRSLIDDGTIPLFVSS